MVKTIIPTLFKVLNAKTYQVGKTVLYKLIHQQYRHQREELLRKKKETYEQTKELK